MDLPETQTLDFSYLNRRAERNNTYEAIRRKLFSDFQIALNYYASARFFPIHIDLALREIRELDNMIEDFSATKKDMEEFLIANTNDMNRRFITQAFEDMDNQLEVLKKVSLELGVRHRVNTENFLFL